MADLLSGQDWAEFQSAIKDATDTFFKLPVQVVTRKRVAALFNEGDDNYEPQTYQVQALAVYDADGKAKVEQSGAADLTGGYLLFNYADLLAADLIDAATNTVAVTAGQDKVVFNGISFYIESPPQLVGPMQDRYALVKLHFHKNIQPVA